MALINEIFTFKRCLGRQIKCPICTIYTLFLDVILSFGQSLRTQNENELWHCFYASLAENWMVPKSNSGTKYYIYTWNADSCDNVICLYFAYFSNNSNLVFSIFHEKWRVKYSI